MTFVQTGTYLDKILAQKQVEVEALTVADTSNVPPPRDFAAALQRDTVALIAEVKKASPSKGLLIADFDPVRLGTTYADNGAAAISVLTDEQFFQGHLDHLRAVRAAVNVPVLRKDFVIDPRQIYAARANGADAVLLIVMALVDEQLADLHALIAELRMTALVEVHDECELERALNIGASVIGVNNRDLRTFQVDLAVTGRLARLVPDGVTLVAESGITTADDVRRMGEMGARAVLVGEALVKSMQIGETVQAFSRQPRGGAMKVKICGITRLEDARAATEAGADLLGFNFYKRSKRYLDLDTALSICAALRAEYGEECPALVGVFVNETVGIISATTRKVGLGFAQLSGDESDSMLAELRGIGFKAIRPATAGQALDDVDYYFPQLPTYERIPSLLLDAYQPGEYGGTGHQTTDDIALAVKEKVPRLMLAGGLTPENVAERVAAVQPWGVDVASGVESAPGIKDAGKMQAFIQNARA